MIIYTIDLFEKTIFEYENIKFIKIKNRCIIKIDNTLWIIRKIIENKECIYENQYDFKNNFFLIQFLIDSGEELIKEELYEPMNLPELLDKHEIQVSKFSKTALKYINK